MKQELLRLSADRYIALILDNEVTVGEFVTTPPLPWVRMIQRGGVFQIAEGYPNALTAAQAKFEMTNWDEVSLPVIKRVGRIGRRGLRSLRKQRRAGFAACAKSARGPSEPRGGYLCQQSPAKKRVRETRLSHVFS